MSTSELDKLSEYLKNECKELPKGKRTHIWLLAYDAVWKAIPSYMGD
jgi:hypothetical protein